MLGVYQVATEVEKEEGGGMKFIEENALKDQVFREGSDERPCCLSEIDARWYPETVRKRTVSGWLASKFQI